jgi:hypothetical protein
MKVSTGNHLRLDDNHVFIDVNELKDHTGFQTTFYEFGTNMKFATQKVFVLKKDKQLSTITTWEDDWREVVREYWHDAEVLYFWEEVKEKK